MESQDVVSSDGGGGENKKTSDVEGLIMLIIQRGRPAGAEQFFNHYLKGMPAPKWMTEGRAASLKQVDEKFELDDGIVEP